MKIGVALDFDNTYEIENLSSDFKTFEFNTEVIDKQTKAESVIRLYVIIMDNHNPFLPQVFNLAFGPLDENGALDDKVAILHKDNSKVYSTLLFGALTFLRGVGDSNTYVGIDGSNMTRAYLYYKLLQINYDYLAQFFRTLGVKYYVRLMRPDRISGEMGIDQQDIAVQPNVILKGVDITCDKLYNYFMFNLIAN